MKLYLVEYIADNIIRNMLVRAKSHDAAENQVKVSMIAKITDDNY